MSELTPEEQQKIYEIEKARRIARKQIDQEIMQATLNQKATPGTFIIAAIVAAVAIFLVWAMKAS